MKKWAQMVVLCLLGLVAIGCASGRSGTTFSRSEALKPMTTTYGVVESVQEGRIEGTKTPIGAVAGGVLGGVAGHAVGGGSGKNIATVAGALVGAGAGALAEEGLTSKKAISITVKMEDGRLITVVQEASVMFEPGQRVAVLEGEGKTRVTLP